MAFLKNDIKITTMKQKDKSLLGNAAEKERQLILSNIMEPNTIAFIEKVNQMAGAKGLHMNCGSGKLTVKLASLVGPTGQITAVDIDQQYVLATTEIASQQEINNISTYEKSAFDKLQKESYYDFAYSRFLFSASPEPMIAVNYLYRRLQPKGILILEDIDLTKLDCFPYSYAFDRFKELLIELTKKTTSEMSLYKMIQESMDQTPFNNTQIQFLSPTFLKGKAKKLTSLTLESAMEAMQKKKIAPTSELHALLTELKIYEDLPNTMISIPGIFQVWTYKME